LQAEAESAEGMGAGSTVGQRLSSAWVDYTATAEKLGKVGAGNFHQLTQMHHSMVAIKSWPDTEMRPVLRAAIFANPQCDPDNAESCDDWWHAQKNELENWTNEANRLLPISGPGRDGGHKMIRKECHAIFEKHAAPHFRRCSERGKEAFESFSADVHNHITELQHDDSGYWQSIFRAATAISMFLRRHCRGRYYSGKPIGSYNNTPTYMARTVKKRVAFTGFDHATHTEKTGSRMPSASDVITASKRVVQVELKRLRELSKLRRLLDERRDKTRAVVRGCWNDEFFMHMGKPGQAPNHSKCPIGAACRNPAVAAQYNWTPLPTLDHQPKTWEVVEHCLKMDSTLKLLDGLITGECASSIESFHSMRCLFAPKQRYFKRWAMRNTMAKFHFNENLNRGIELTYLSKVRKLGKTVSKNKKVNPTWDWMTKVVNKVMRL
jgi:hypothetical protein